jgi:hypothetical protein
MWSRTVRNALEARSVSDNDSDSDRSDASTPTSSPTRPAPNRRRTAAPAKALASGEDVHAPASELNTAETLLIDGDLSQQCRQCANVAVAEEAPEAAHDAFKPKNDADPTRSAEAVGPSQPEVRSSLSTRLLPHTAAEEEEAEEEIPSQRAPLQRAAVSPGRFANGTCRGDIIAFFVCRRRQMLSPLWEVLRKLRDALADGGKDAWALPFGARLFTPG